MRMISRLILIPILAFVSHSLPAQLITTDPPFPLPDAPVTITFDASLGSGGLEGYEGTVYAHTGLITEESNNGSDWRYVKTNWGQNTPGTRMERIGEDLYQLEMGPNIRDYYGVPQGEEIEEMAFVFRSASQVNGQWLEGKTANFDDIYVPVYDNPDSFQLQVFSPNQNLLIFDPGDSLDLSLATSQPAHIQWWLDGEAVIDTSGITMLETPIATGDTGTHDLQLLAISPDADSLLREFQYLVTGPTPVAPLPDSSRIGVEDLGDGRARFVLEAPGKEKVLLIGSVTDWQPESGSFQMRRSPDGRYFWTEISGLDSGTYYTYQYLVDDEGAFADPLSEVVLDPDQDPWISELPDSLPDFPEAADGITSVLKWGGHPHDFQHDAPPLANEDLVIYELLVRDFLDDHQFRTLRDSLDYLQSLGVNAIELMPVQEFEGNISWGYNPSFHGAVDKYYGRPEDLKALIDEAHRRGMLVLLDVVYNHAFSQATHCQLYWDDQNFQPSPDNPWLNVTARHPFSVGYDYNHKYEGTRDYVKATLQRWLEEYRFDGFRFDLSKGFTQRQNDDVFDWGLYDADRISILKEYADFIWQIKPEAKVILEHFAEDREERELAEYGMMTWNNVAHAYGEATMGYHDNRSSDLSPTYFGHRDWTEPHLISYMESHDEERLMYKNNNFGNQRPGYSTRNPSNGLQRVAGASVIFYSLPGPKMLWQFGELGYNYSINHCENGSIDNSCRTGPKPIRWDYFEDPERFQLWAATADLIHLKRSSDFFSADLRVAPLLHPPLKRMRIGDSVAVLVNLGLQEESVVYTFPAPGTWYEFFSGDSVTLQNTLFEGSLQPGEYRLYLREPKDRSSGFYTSAEQVHRQKAQLQVAPNPVRDRMHLYLGEEWANENKQLLLYNAQGQLVHQQSLDPQHRKVELEFEGMPAGTYHLVLYNSHWYGHRQVVKIP